jgi:hypothetical protein
MLKMTSLMLCLMLPAASFAEGPAPATGAAEVAPAAAAPDAAQAALTPTDAAAPAPAVAEARWCSSHGCGGGKAKWIVLTGVTATVVTAVAVGVAVSVASSHNNQVVR